MGLFRATAFAAVPIFLILTASQASACSCGTDTPKEKFAKAELVVRGRMKLVTYGVEMPRSESRDEGDTARVTRGEFEIEKVLKGTLPEKAVSIYTGSGLGDCGLLNEFITSAFYYRDEKFGVLELSLTKNDIAGQTLYSANMCDYVKGPKDTEQ